MTPGLSSHFTDAPAPDLQAALAGDFSSASYTLSDMAADTVGPAAPGTGTTIASA